MSDQTTTSASEAAAGPEVEPSTRADPGARPARGRPTRRWSLWVGLLLVAAGLVMLGWIAWQMFGTNLVSNARHADLVEQLEREWDADPSRPASETVSTDHGAAGAIMRVPAFGDDYAVPVLDGVGDEELASGMGHFTDSARAGGRGNYALAGHRVTHGEPLRAMPDLDAGDEIVIETRAKVYTYVLDTAGDGLRVPFTAGWVVGDRPRNPDPAGVGPVRDSRRLITLTTCAELFHTDDRLVAFGHLVSTQDRVPAA